MPHFTSVSRAYFAHTNNNPAPITEPQARTIVETALDEDAQSTHLCGLIKGHKGHDAVEGLVSLHSDRFEKEALTTVRYYLQHHKLRPAEFIPCRKDGFGQE